MQVLKISGSQLDEPTFLGELVRVLKGMNEPTIIVHGGGKEISQLQNQFGIQPQYIDGLRVSDSASLELVKMVLCGAVNTRIVTALQLAGITAQGLSGLDQGLVKVRKMGHPSGDLGWVGEVVSVRGEVLRTFLAQGITPVIAPICLGEDGAYNVNADHVAGAVGGAVNAERVIFLTNVPGVLHKGQLIERLTAQTITELIAQKVIVDGMIPKVKTALEMVERGAAQVIITNLDGLKQLTGTAIVRN
jgi:acetylglutamate kinase